MFETNEIQKLSYNHESAISIELLNHINYSQLLSKYDKSFLNTMKNVHPEFLNTSVHEFRVLMQPEMLEWKYFFMKFRFYKNNDEILVFLKEINSSILEMQKNMDRMHNNGNEIIKLYQEISKFTTGNDFSSSNLTLTTKLLNLFAQNAYIQKTEEFLLFIEHCVPVDKWDMKIYKHFYVYKAPTLFAGFGQDKRERDFFITVASDGIMKSDNHLLQSRVNFMIPFTNQLTIECKRIQKEVAFIVQACSHEQLIINFYKDYVSAINFIIALNQALEESEYSNGNHRFDSFSPIREKCASKLYVDGAEYYDDLYETLINAKWQVCITGWMITPYFLLKRPNKIDSKEYRLDGVLQSLAERGVKIYIICFMEPKIAVNNDSEHVQILLESLHDNIKVYRHPNTAIPILWSHHEKMVIIDQEIGFMGGLDICYGRWDHSGHLLKDPGMLWDGADYNNYRIRDIYKPRDYKNSNLQKGFEPRMPWHDIALQYRGDIVLDLLRHFVQYWYFVKSELLVDFTKTANFLQRRYQQAFNTQKSQSEKEEAKYYLAEFRKREENATLGQRIKFMFNGREERFQELFIQTKPGKVIGEERLQMCRSASEWSIGVRNGQHESSIHSAYQTLINESKNFIYIENQFFMGLENKVVECLAKRIEKAFRNKEKFKLIVVMPLLPGFEGNISDPTSSVLRIQVHHQFQAILRGENSLFKRLHFIPDIHEFVYFFGLRQSEMVDNTPMTEIIYVHSKLMIVDDERAIIGSANINDRSLLGTRDSEIACVIEEKSGSILNLRYRLFLEHFGLTKEECLNINTDKVWRSMIKNSNEATRFYREVFGCIPDDEVTCSREIEKLASKANFSKFVEGRKRLKGFAVDFPLQFMKDEDLRIRPGQLESFAPESMFT